MVSKSRCINGFDNFLLVNYFQKIIVYLYFIILYAKRHAVSISELQWKALFNEHKQETYLLKIVI